MLYDDNDPQSGDVATKAFKAVKDEYGWVQLYTVTINKKAEFNHVLELV